MATPRRHPTIIRRMRDSRLKHLGSGRPFVAASLVEVPVRCGRKGCHCTTGEGHPSFYLTLKQGKKTHTVYVPKARVDEVRQWVQEHRRIKMLIREISQLSLDLLKAEAPRRKAAQRKRGRS